jgi:CP family cyanate transporter-like MFS transporter
VRKVSGVVAVLAVVLVSLNLRPGASSVGPVLAEVRDGLGMGSGVAGVVTGLPGLCFGIVGATAVALARRVGTTAGIALGVLLATAGLLLRATTGSTALFLVLTTVALAGMAIGNVLVPAWIKAHSSSHGRESVLLPTVYGTALIIGGTVGSAFTAPVAESDAGWRVALGMWGAAVGLALPLWAWLAVREGRLPPPQPGAGGPRRSMTSSPTAVAMAWLFGVQSMHAYVQFGWLPQIYRDAGLSASAAGLLQALLSGVGVGGALLMPTVIARSRTLSPWMLGFGVLMVLGYAGLLLAPATLPWLWALALGTAGWAFPTSIALLTARTRTSGVTARLSGFVQPVGYALAAIGPFLVGLLHDATGDWDLVLVLLALTAVPFTWAGLRAARPVWVDDELAA